MNTTTLGFCLKGNERNGKQNMKCLKSSNECAILREWGQVYQLGHLYMPSSHLSLFPLPLLSEFVSCNVVTQGRRYA